MPPAGEYTSGVLGSLRSDRNLAHLPVTDASNSPYNLTENKPDKSGQFTNRLQTQRKSNGRYVFFLLFPKKRYRNCPQQTPWTSVTGRKPICRRHYRIKRYAYALRYNNMHFIRIEKHVIVKLSGAADFITFFVETSPVV